MSSQKKDGVNCSEGTEDYDGGGEGAELLNSGSEGLQPNNEGQEGEKDVVEVTQQPNILELFRPAGEPGKVRRQTTSGRGRGSTKAKKPRIVQYGKVHIPLGPGVNSTMETDSNGAESVINVADNDGIPEAADVETYRTPACPAKVPKNAKSAVWMYFEIDAADPTKAVCKMCNVKVYRGKGKAATTTSMSNHLEAKHGVYAKSQGHEKTHIDSTMTPRTTEMLQLDLRSSFDATKSWEFNDPRAMELTRKIGEMLVSDNLPYNFVQKSGFLGLMKHSKPRYKVPSPKYFADVVTPEIHRNVSLKISRLLETAKYISFTTDIWTSSNNHGFISLTVHWVNENFATRNFVLCMKHFPGEHSAENIKTKIEEILRDWKIKKSCVHVMIRDNAANITNGITLAGFQSISCYIHSVQLVVSDSMKVQRAVIDVLAKCRGIVAHVHRAHNISDRFMAMQKESGREPKVLFQDVATRWNSTYYMLERFQYLKQYVLLMLSEYEFTHTLNSNDWNLITSLLALLKPFEIVTRLFSSEHCYASEIIPSIRSLKLMLSLDSSVHFGVGSMKSELLNQMNLRFAEEIFENNPDLTFATLLDPRYKLAFFTRENQLQVKDSFIQYLVRQFKNAAALKEDDSSASTSRTLGLSGQSQPDSSTPDDLMWSAYKNIMESFERAQNVNLPNESAASKDAIFKAELNMYLAEKSLPVFQDENRTERNDPLKWWKVNFSKFPNLGSMIFKYLSSPASSVYSERLFSEAGNVYESKRNSLKPENASKLVFLKHNLRVLDYNYLDN